MQPTNNQSRNNQSTLTMQAIEAQHKATNPKAHTWVMASAGTGKTKVLTERILRLLIQGVEPTSILALTFTNAAADEMADRVLTQLKTWAVVDTAQVIHDLENLLNAQVVTDQQISAAQSLIFKVNRPDKRFQIQTVHSFCQNILSHFSLEAGMPLSWELSKDYDQNFLLQQAIDRAMNQPVLTPLLEKYAVDYLKKMIAEICSQSAIQRLFATHTLPEIIGELRQILNADAAVVELDPQKWPLTELINALSCGVEKEVAVATILNHANQRNDYKQIIATIRDFGFTAKNEPRKKIFSAQFVKLNPSYAGFWAVIQESYQHYFDNMKVIQLYEMTASLWQTISLVLKNYQELKAQRKLIDFNDLLFYTLRVLHQPHINHWLLYKLSLKFSHILIDEAQDTSVDQWSIILKILEDFFVGQTANRQDKSVFIVGDEKQSIYRFQGADPESYGQVKHLLKEKVTQSNHMWQELNLQISFRSAPAILEFINHVFKNTDLIAGMGQDKYQLDHRSAYPQRFGKVSIWPMTTRSSDDDDLKTLRTHARKIATMIQGWFTQQKWLPDKGNGKGRVIEPRDIMILCQYRSPLFHEIINTLKYYNLPVAGPDRLKLLDQLYIQDLIAIIKFVINPQDDYNLACLLKGPLLRLNDDDLFQICYTRSNSVWQALQSHRHYESVVKTLRTWQELSFKVTVYEFYTHVMYRERGYEKFIGVFGHSCQDGVQAFLDYTLQFKSENPIPKINDFLTWFLQLKPILKRDAQMQNSIRVMTIHGAKGLQAPIVILPDTTYLPQDKNKIFWTVSKEVESKGVESKGTVLKGQKLPLFKLGQSDIPDHLIPDYEAQITDDRHEYYRLFYVAVTRAESELYIMGPAPKRKSSAASYYDLIHDYLTANPTIPHLSKDDVPHDADSTGDNPLVENSDEAQVGWTIQSNVTEMQLEHPAVTAVDPRRTTLPPWYEQKFRRQPYTDRIIYLNDRKGDAEFETGTTATYLKNCHLIGRYDHKNYGFYLNQLKVDALRQTLTVDVALKLPPGFSQIMIQQILKHILLQIYCNFTVNLNLIIK